MITPYHIVSEFRFDIAHAVADSKTLQGAVGGISNAADSALINMRRASAGLVAQMGLVSGGFLGFLYNAIQSSEKFGQSQRNLANIIYTNKDTLGLSYMSFNKTLTMTSEIMEDIRKKAESFALDPSALINTTKSISPVLLSHGLDDKKLSTSIDISRGLLKSAPTLGVDPNLVQGQLTNMLLGHASMNDTLFQRLASETAPFKEGNITTSKSFNNLDAHKRVEMVRKALLQFGSTAEVIEGNVNSLNGHMTRFTSLIKGEFSILKPLGEALIVPIKKAFTYVNTWLSTEGRTLVQNVSTLLAGFIEDPVKAYVRLKQLSRLQGDTKNASSVAQAIGLYTALRFVLAAVGIQTIGFGAAIMKVVGWMRTALVALFSNSIFLTILSNLFIFLKAAVVEFITIMGPLLFLFQILSATIAKVQVIWATWMANNAGRMSEALLKLSDAFGRIMLPITMAIDGMSDVLSSVIGWFVTKEILLQFFEGLAWVLNIVSMAVVTLMASLNALVGMLFSLLNDLINMDFKNMLPNMIEESDRSFTEFWNKAFKIKNNPEDKDGVGSVAKSVTNIGNLNINQQIKEQVEPDRIAFSAVEAFSKIAQNPTRGYNTRLNAGLVGR